MRGITMRWYTRFCFGWICLVSMMLPPLRGHADDGDSQIKSDEQVLFFPTAAHWDGDRESWHVPVHGWIFEPEEDSVARSMIVGELCSLLTESSRGSIPIRS